MAVEEEVSLQVRTVCSVHRDISWRRCKSYRYSFFSSLLLLLSFVHRSSQVLEFRSEPSQYYYSRPGFLITIPCQVVDVDPVTRRLTYVPANISVNGTTVARGQPPPQDHVLWITNEVVSGIIILRVQQEFSGWEYSCRASYNDQELESLTSTLYVGDGSPLPPVENPVYMSDTGLTSLTIMWGVAPVPLDAPLLGYNITYESVNGTGDQNYVETSNNSTAITLTSLKLATTYSIRVQGINKIGAGNLSAPLLASTMVGVPPLPPTSVTVTDISLVTASNYRVKLQWAGAKVDPAMMTPITSYSIYFNNEREEPVFLASTDSSLSATSVEVMNLSKDILFSIGVAAKNMAGESEVTYHSDLIVVVTSAATSHPISSLLVGGIALATTVLLLCSLLVFVLIVFIRYRTRSMRHSYSPNKGSLKSPDSSPVTVRKSSSSDARKETKSSSSDARKETKSSSSDARKETSSNETSQSGDNGQDCVEMYNMSSVTGSFKKRTRKPSLEATNHVSLTYYNPAV